MYPPRGTVYVNREEFIRELAIPDLSDIHVLLLDGEGQALWRAEGPVGDESLASLSNVLESVSRMLLSRRRCRPTSVISRP